MWGGGLSSCQGTPEQSTAGGERSQARGYPRVNGYKIVYFINRYPKVSHTFIRRELLALERCGFEVLRIALRGWNGPSPDPEDRLERNLTRYVLRQGPLSLVLPVLVTAVTCPGRFLQAIGAAVHMSRDSARPLAYHLMYLAEACRVAQWTNRFGARHIHAHFGTNSTEIVLLAHILGGPRYSFTVHGTDEFTTRMSLAEKVHRARFVVAVSSYVRSQIYMRCEHSDWKKIKVIHCGLERAYYASDPEPVIPGARLICVGRLCEAKGQLLLVEAAAQLAERGMQFDLILAGDGPLRPAIEALIQEYGLADRIFITGWISGARVREQIRAARALILPSFSEGLPVVIMEAMALRRPVLATHVAGIPELVRDGENGWLVPAGSSEELAMAMARCLAATPQEIQALGNAAYECVFQRHLIDTEVNQLAQLFLNQPARVSPANRRTQTPEYPQHRLPESRHAAWRPRLW